MLSALSWSPSALARRSRVAGGALGAPDPASRHPCLTGPSSAPAAAGSAAYAPHGRQREGAWRRGQRQGGGEATAQPFH
eukprot:5521701-Pleurochrysis_carterae.AAC.1